MITRPYILSYSKLDVLFVGMELKMMMFPCAATVPILLAVSHPRVAYRLPAKCQLWAVFGPMQARAWYQVNYGKIFGCFSSPKTLHTTAIYSYKLMFEILAPWSNMDRENDQKRQLQRSVNVLERRLQVAVEQNTQIASALTWLLQALQCPEIRLPEENTAANWVHGTAGAVPSDSGWHQEQVQNPLRVAGRIYYTVLPYDIKEHFGASDHNVEGHISITSTAHVITCMIGYWSLMEHASRNVRWFVSKDSPRLFCLHQTKMERTIYESKAKVAWKRCLTCTCTFRFLISRKFEDVMNLDVYPEFQSGSISCCQNHEITWIGSDEGWNRFKPWLEPKPFNMSHLLTIKDAICASQGLQSPRRGISVGREHWTSCHAIAICRSYNSIQ